MVNSIWGKVIWYRNTGSADEPELAAAEPIEVEWEGAPPKPEWNWWSPRGNELATQWRTTPFVTDLTRDGLNDLIMLDHEGYLALFERTRGDRGLRLLPGRRVFRDENGNPLRLNERAAGKSGRRKFTMADWDGDGRLDILINGSNIDFLRGIGDGNHRFRNEGAMGSASWRGIRLRRRSSIGTAMEFPIYSWARRMACSTTSPTRDRSYSESASGNAMR